MSAQMELLGASCASHPDRGASFTCTRCGDFRCPECQFSNTPGHELCKTCAAQGLVRPVAWERRDEIGLFRAFMDTTVEACGQPGRFFRTYATEGGLTAPLIYAFVVTTVGNVMNFGIALLIAIVAAPHDPAVMGLVSVTICSLPVLVLIDVALGGSFVHATLSVFGQAHASRSATLRAFAYAKAPFFFQVIPCYGLALMPWVPIVEIAAVREVHRIDTLPAAVSVLGYRLLWAGLVVAITLMAGT